jgi:ELWxxDGT repeat protein
VRTPIRLAVTLLAASALAIGVAAPATAVPSPTEQVVDINPGAGDSHPYDFIELDGLLYFTADDGSGTELWYTDGSIGSATKIDINPGGASNPSNFVVWDNALYFSADTGPAYGTELVVVSGGLLSILSDINPGPADADPSDLTLFDDALYFTAYSPGEGQVLRKYDGTVTTYPTSTSMSAPSDYFEYDGYLYFAASTPTENMGFFRLDGTNPPTLVQDLNPTSFAYPHRFSEAGGALYFLSNVAPGGPYQYELWTFDGTTATQLTTGLSSTNGFQYYAVYNDVLYFAAGTTATGAEIGSTSAGAVPTFYDINPGAAGSGVEEIAGYKGAVYFGADNGTAGYELFRLAPGGAPTLVADIAPGATDSYPFNFTVVGDALAFSASGDGTGWELWSYNGTAVNQESSIYPGGDADVYGLAAFNGYVYFDATSAAGGAEVWRTLIAASAAAPAPTLAAAGTDSLLPAGLALALLLAGIVVVLRRRRLAA